MKIINLLVINNDSDGDNDEIASNESQVGEVCTSWVLLRHSIVAALGHFDGGDFDSSD